MADINITEERTRDKNFLQDWEKIILEELNRKEQEKTGKNESKSS